MNSNEFYYSLLPTQTQALFRENVIDQHSVGHFKKYLRDKSRDFHHFINLAFVWNNTAQGQQYWNKIANDRDYIEEGIKIFQKQIREKDIDIQDLKVQLADLQKQNDELALRCKKAEDKYINSYITAYQYDTDKQ